MKASLPTRDGTHLFVYGTLRRDVGHPMHSTLARHAILIGSGSFQGKLYDLGRFPGAAASGRRSDRVVGEVYRLRPTVPLLEILDDYEGEQFRRQATWIRLDGGGTLKTWIYLYRGAVNPRKRIRGGDYLAFRAGR